MPDAAPRKGHRFWIALQPSIVRLYKVAGLLALTAILIGLIGFLVVNVYYFFDHTWVRPVVLSPTHRKVVEASTLLGDAKLRASLVDTERVEIDSKLTEIDRTVASDDRFIIAVGTTVDKPATPDQWLVHRELEKAKLDKANAIGLRGALNQRLESLNLRKGDQDGLVKRLEQSPYLRAIDQKIVLAFVPYQNLRNVKIGTKLYGCAWGLRWKARRAAPCAATSWTRKTSSAPAAGARSNPRSAPGPLPRRSNRACWASTAVAAALR